MKKRIKILLIIILAVICEIIWVDIQSIRVEKELDALCDYSVLCHDNGFEWKKEECYISHNYYLDSYYKFPSFYVVGPFGGSYFDGFIVFSPSGYKEFPEDLIKTQYSPLKMYLPQSEYTNQDWSSSCLMVSFDRAYSIAEVEEKLPVGEIIWLWLDSYEDNYQGAITKYNIYGIPIQDSISDSKDEINNVLAVLNKYDENEKTKTGKMIYDIRKNIKGEGEVKAEDLQILGCVIWLSQSEMEEYKDSNMFKVVENYYTYIP